MKDHLKNCEGEHDINQTPCDTQSVASAEDLDFDTENPIKHIHDKVRADSLTQNHLFMDPN